MSGPPWVSPWHFIIIFGSGTNFLPCTHAAWRSERGDALGEREMGSAGEVVYSLSTDTAESCGCPGPPESHPQISSSAAAWAAQSCPVCLLESSPGILCPSRSPQSHGEKHVVRLQLPAALPVRCWQQCCPPGRVCF